MSEYAGLVGAYRFAFRRSGSWLFRSYVVVSALVGLYVAVLLSLALVTWIARPSGLFGDRGLLAVIGILVLVPLSAPVLLVARRYRRADGTAGADPQLALAGYAFISSIVLALFVSDPNEHALSGAPALVLGPLDRLPRTAGIVFPVLAVLLIAFVAWRTKPP